MAELVAGNDRRSWRRDAKSRPREGHDPDNPDVETGFDSDSDEFAAGSGNSSDSPLLISWFEKKPARSRLTGASKRRTLLLVKMVMVSGIIYVVYSLFWTAGTSRAGPCSTIDQGYRCFTPTSRLWGQYSPYFAVQEDSGPSSSVPNGCNVTFVQVLSRHGARFPTSSKSAKYASLIEAIQRNATSFNGEAAFLETFRYALGADDLVPFGEAQMVDSGIKFYERYRDLARDIVPFVRASGSDRVVASGEKFIEGFQRAKSTDTRANQTQSTPVISVILEETPGFNNTLDHSVCTEFEDDNDGHQAKANFTDLFVPSIKSRLEASLPGVSLSHMDVISLMDMCPFETVGKTPDASVLSPFCTLFTQDEWIKYDYLQSLDKYYANGAGNLLGPAQGIGFTNELIARLMQTPVQDETSTNRTLDSDPATFPLNATLYADFSHDNSMIGIFSALGLYNGTVPLSLTHVETVEQMDGYSAAWAVPFGARAYVERMQCRSDGERMVQEPLVRILVNDRVVPLHGCEVDGLGRCRLTDFVDGLSFARSGGNWGSCYR